MVWVATRDMKWVLGNRPTLSSSRLSDYLRLINVTVLKPLLQVGVSVLLSHRTIKLSFGAQAISEPLPVLRMYHKTILTSPTSRFKSNQIKLLS